MLFNTFIHLPGIGHKTEQRLWKASIRTWDDYQSAFPPQSSLFTPDDEPNAPTVLAESRAALERGDADYFAERLPKSEHYRIALTFPSNTVFLDIETTGLSHYYDKITVIGLGIGDEYLCHIKSTDKSKIHRWLKNAKCMVTFNGTIFDTKFLAKEFPEIRLPSAHVDLRFLAKSVGLLGGQKHIEDRIGVKRINDIADMRGERAPLLWHEYLLGNQDSAKRLIEYNHADIEGMKSILDIVLRRMAERGELPEFVTTNHFSAAKSKLSWAKRKETAAKNRIFVPPYRGKRGPQIHYKELAITPPTAHLRIVGIDLTGSPTRPTGWCLLHGSHAHTGRLADDADILVRTLNALPDLVSIDSPLSLPAGRNRPTDDDPGREQFGIVRQCERTLMERGVNVYPSLINSMQGLTARGIRLANHFRQLGVPVIESYPGAAQDIMGIPRKRAGSAFLTRGLADFGITGGFMNDNVSHDELDAITAAAVGLFFWSGKFEALGNDDEDYLIVPDLEVSPKDWREREVIGISGPIAAGKTTGANILKERGYSYGRYSMVLADLLREKGCEPSREALQALGDQVHNRPGQRWLSKQLVKRLDKSAKVVIDGLRFPEDHAHLVEEFGPAFRHIHVQCPEEIRKDRYQKMGFRVPDFLRASAHSVEAKVNLLARLAHSMILNDGTLDAFARRLIRAAKS